MSTTKQLRFPPHIKNKIIRPIPASLIKQRDGGGGKQLSYISGSTVIDMLNDAFGYIWNWEVVEQYVQDGFDYFNQYSKAPAAEQVMNAASGKKGTWDKQGPVAHVRGRLTVFFFDEEGVERKIVKEGFGSKSIIGKQNEQESIFKAAGTDALKKAASLLGIGAELYRDEDEMMYFNEITYEDPWTDELKAKHKDSLDFLRQVMEDYDLDADGISPYIIDFSDSALYSIEQIVPDNVEAFVAYMKEKIEQAAAEQPAE